MLRVIKQVFVGLLSFRKFSSSNVNTPNHVKCNIFE